jgi:hypothetical protein
VSAHWWHAIGEMLFLCLAEGRFFVPACRSTCKKETSAVLGQACPGSEQEGPARVAPCPHERRSGARGRCLFAHRGKPGWHSVAVFEHAASGRGHGSFRGLPNDERAATWRRGGRHRYVPCAINAVRRVATKNAGLPCLVPAGRATA